MLIYRYVRIDADDILPAQKMHDMVCDMYSWEDVSMRTEKVGFYEVIMVICM